MTNTDPTEEARAVAGELLQRIALDASGAPFDDNDPETWAAADATEPEIIRLGAIRFRVVSDAADLAVAAGALDPGDSTLALRVTFDQGTAALRPAIGQYIVLPTDEPGVSLVFRVWLTHAELNDPAVRDLGPEAQRNEALAVLLPGEALLVQALENAGAPE